MATCKVLLDTRIRLKGNLHNLVIRIFEKNDFVDLKIGKLTEIQYRKIFEKKSTDSHSIEYRQRCDNQRTRAERIYDEVGHLDKELIKNKFFEKDKPKVTTLNVAELFENFTKNYEGIKLTTQKRYQYSGRFLHRYDPNLTVTQLTSQYLKKFESNQRKSGISQPTINSILRDLRRIINYFLYEDKLIPDTFIYPFGKQGYSIGSSFSSKTVLSKEEIQKVVDLNEFESPKEEFARDIWLFLYRCNGINFVDAMKMKWSNRKTGYIEIQRQKTETTRRNNKKPIIIPVTDKLNDLIKKIGVIDSPYILGLIDENYTETSFNNKCHKLKGIINANLQILTNRLGLSVPLKMKTARESYATTLLRNGTSKDYIGEMLGHANSIVTEHYLAGLDKEKFFEINDSIL